MIFRSFKTIFDEKKLKSFKNKKKFQKSAHVGRNVLFDSFPPEKS